jgi:hypothetical protein
LGGEVEIDESFIGGKARNMHRDRRLKTRVRTGGGGKTIVLGMLERGKSKRVRTTVVPDRTKPSMKPEIMKRIETGANLISDEFTQGWFSQEEFLHQVVNHAVEYVRGNIHTNGMENFWSLLKRGLHGTYISVEPFHLFRYLDEQAFRFNNHKDEDGEIRKDADRFDQLVLQIVGKRLTYSQLTGKELQKPATEASI